VALLFVELTDVIFAIDSVPAIFAITREPLIVFTSNVFAILGLRALYFLLAGAAEMFHLLRYGLAVVLIFVGLKMLWLNDLYGGKFPVTHSLGFISLAIVSSAVLSLVVPKPGGGASSGVTVSDRSGCTSTGSSVAGLPPARRTSPPASRASPRGLGSAS
jgi:tellurite resistance protein TerC